MNFSKIGMGRYISVFFIFTVFGSCDFDRPDQLTLIEGKTINYYTYDVLNDITLIVDRCKRRMIYPEICYRLDTLYSDSTGSFQYQFYNQRYSFYQIWSVGTEDYAPAYGYLIKEGNTNKINIKIKPYEKLQVNIIVNDTTSRLQIYTAPIFNTNLYHQEMEMYDLKNDTSVFIKVAPEESNYIYWEATRLGRHFEWIQIDAISTEYFIVLDSKLNE